MFKFSLDTLYRLKLQLEEQAKIRLTLAVAKREEELETLKQINSALTDAQAEFKKGFYQEGRDLQTVFKYSQYLAQQVSQQEQVVAQHTQLLDNARLELLEVRKEVQKLERLRAKKYREYWSEQLRQEQNALDEVAAGRYFRNRETC